MVAPPRPLPASPRDDRLVEATPDALAALAARYAFRTPAAVTSYLRGRPELVPILLEAADVIPRYFGNDAPLTLEIYIDPYDDDPPTELFVMVQTTLPSEEALGRLDHLDDDWWFKRVPAGFDWPIVGIERA